MIRQPTFHLVALGNVSHLTLGEVDGPDEEADRTRYTIPA